MAVQREWSEWSDPPPRIPFVSSNQNFNKAAYQRRSRALEQGGSTFCGMQGESIGNVRGYGLLVHVRQFCVCDGI